MSAQITMTQAINRAIDEAMAEDEGVILLGEDVAAKQGGGVFKISSGLTEKYGESRIRATPISEQAIVGVWRAKRGGPVLRVYHCPCGGWHLTSKTDREVAS